MKIESSYVCEICGARFGDDFCCREHEKMHVNPIRILGHSYHQRAGRFLASKSGRYPDEIEVEFEDGEVLTYEKRWDGPIETYGTAALEVYT